MQFSSQELERNLKQHFGFSDLREAQKPVVEAVLNGSDVLAIMPTGGGKSLCYQLPAMILPGLTVVISPLIALMHDQVEALKENGIWAEFLNSSQSLTEQNLVLDALRDWKNNPDSDTEKLKLLYLSPEKLLSGNGVFLKALTQIPVSLFAVDEAHCISSWGHDFRPEYTQLSAIRQIFPDTPLLALTATADQLTQKDIQHKLEIDEQNTFISSFDRPNIQYHVEPKIGGTKRLISFIEAQNGAAGIVYCLSRKSTENIAEKLSQKGISAKPFHAGLPQHQKDSTFAAFMRDEVQVVVATIAFGMGIDKPNVRFVAHWNLPKNIENYYQETGRAGRDGLPATALLLYSASDAVTLRSFIMDTSEVPEHLSVTEQKQYQLLQLDKLNRLMELCQTGSCRRRVLLNYFNQKMDHDCGNCDRCLYPPTKVNGTVIAQKILSAIARTGQNFGAGYIVDILRGTENERITTNGHDQIPTFGVGKDWSKNEWNYYLAELIGLSVIEVEYSERFRILKLGEKAMEVLRGEKLELVEFQKPAKTKQERGERKAKFHPKNDLSDTELELFEHLRKLRMEIAKQQNVPPYVIFGDKTLVEIARTQPKSKQEFLDVNGVGKSKLEKFGVQFLQAVAEFANPNSM